MAKRTSKTANRNADDRILTTREVLDRIPIDRSTLWRLCRDGQFPKPIQLTRARIGWRWSRIAAWLADREAHPIEAREYFGGSADAQ